jgi:aminopeptidase N
MSWKFLGTVVLLASSFVVCGQRAHQHALCSDIKKSAKGAFRKASAHPSLSLYDVKFYHLDIEADNLSTHVNAAVKIKAEVNETPLNQFVVELSSSFQIDSVYINDEKVEFLTGDNLVIAQPAEELSPSTLFEAVVYYQGNGVNGGNFFSGISNGIAQPFFEHVTWTLSEPLNAIDWFACKQDLNDKADSAYVFITVPNNLKAGSNGVLADVVDVGDGMTRYEWKTRYPIAFYLISMSIAEYEEFNFITALDGKDVLVQNFVYPTALESVKDQLLVTGDLLETFSGFFGMYPFAEEKYGHTMAPLGGGMEHQTMSTMQDFPFQLNAHELAHQWFGNYVTCSSWQDIWLNEGFATYSEYLALEALKGPAAASTMMNDVHSIVLAQTAGSVHVPDNLSEDENRIFDWTLTYNKGAALVHMLRKIINDDALFFSTLRSFLSDYQYSTATAEQFKSHVTEKTNIDFNQFFEEWYYGEGYPRYAVRWNHDSDTLYLKLSQSTSAPVTSFFHTPVEFIGEREGADTVFRVVPEAQNQLIKIYSPSAVTKLRLDPYNWLVDKSQGPVRDLSLVPPSLVIGVHEDFKRKFQIYPNPAKNRVFIHSETTPFRVSILDITGRRVLPPVDVTGVSEYEILDLPAGFYFLHITDGNTNAFYKVEIVP